MWIKKIIWWLILVYSFDEISAFNNILYQRSPTPHTQMSQLFKSCYSEQLNPVVITKNLIDIIDELRSDDIKFQVMTIDSDFKAKDLQMFIPAYPLYIVSTDSIDQFQGLLNELKSTPTWNIVSKFFFIETAENHCQHASQVLQLLWKLELLSSFYFCIEPNNDIMLYTYNPYTSRAPDSWSEVDTDDKPDNRWTLYKQLYTPNNEEVCQSLGYDKTKALDGYEVKATGDTLSWKNITRNETYDVSSFDYTLVNVEKMFMVSLFSALNVTPRINYDDPGFYSNKTASGFLKSLINATHDVGVSMRIRDRAIEFVDRINLYYQNGFLVLTQYKPFEIPTDEVADFYDFNPGFVLFILVLSITFITIALNSDNDYAHAVLDLLRMVLGNGILTPLQRSSMRICFVVSFLMIFFINPAIQGKILSFLSAPGHRDVGSFQDIYDRKYDFYYDPFLEAHILDLNLWSNLTDRKLLHPTQFVYFGCSDYVLNNSSTACLAFSELQIEDALKHNLHVTKTFDLTYYMTFWVKNNWALKDRIDQIAFRMTEAGLLDHWDKPTLHWPLSKIKAYESIKTSTQYEQFELENMLMPHIFLLLTAIFALFVFGFEILLRKFRPRRQLQLQQRIVIFNRRVHVINEWI